MKADTRDAGAEVKESGLFSGAGHLEYGGLMSQSSSPKNMGESHHPGFPVEGQQISQNWDAWRSRSVSFEVSS